MSATSEGSWARRLVSPSGLALVLLCLFLPFVGVSCDSSLGTLEVRVTGWDMAVNGEPSVTGTGVLDQGGASEPSSLPEEVAGGNAQDRVGVQPFMLAGVLAVLTGLVLGVVLQSRYSRALGGLVASALGLLLILVNEAVVIIALEDEIASGTEWGASDAVVGTRFGFWVTVVLLAGVVGHTTVDLALDRRRASGPPAPFGPPDPPGPPSPFGPRGPLAGPYGPPAPPPGPPPSGPWPPPEPPSQQFPPPGRRDDPYGPPYG